MGNSALGQKTEINRDTISLLILTFGEIVFFYFFLKGDNEEQESEESSQKKKADGGEGA